MTPIGFGSKFVSHSPGPVEGQYWCRFGTRLIRTTIPLPVLPPVFPDASRADLICIDWINEGAPPNTDWNQHWWTGEEITLSLAQQDNGFWLRSPNIADFLIQLEPIRILVAPESSTDASTLEHLLVDQVLPRLLAHQGALMLHASAVAFSERNALFAGISGWGKSTLAGLLHRQGQLVLSDDCVQLVREGNNFHAVPTYPSLRLYSDSLNELFPGSTDTTTVAAYSEKRRVPISAPPSNEISFPVHALYFLGIPSEANNMIRISQLPPTTICQAILRFSFRLDLGDRAANTDQFTLCGAVARAIPSYRLDYPREFTRAEELLRYLTDHLSSVSGRH